jgi:hypothetical protein
MADVLAIISKAQFEKLAGKGAQPGALLSTRRYDSLHKALEPLEGGGSLFLVTVRPPNDALWLVAVLEAVKRDGKGWTSAGNSVAMTDISDLKAKIRFASGTGMSAKAGALGMSLQTPRELAPGDVKLLRAKLPKGAAAKSAAKKPTAATPAPKAAAAKGPAGAAQIMDAGQALMDGAIAQLGEVIDDAKDDPNAYLRAPKWKPSYVLRGLFTESVQSIYSGAIDAKEACRMLGEELAPFVDGAALAMVLRACADEVKDADDLYGEIVDHFAIRAVDDLARGLLALALDRPNEVPATCARYRSLLERNLPQARELL